MGLRVSDSYEAGLVVRSMQNALAQMLRFQQMSSTQRRINGWSDDPRGVSSVQRYDTLLSLNAQYSRNLQRTRTYVDATDGALQDLLGALRESRTLVLRETTASADDDSNDRSAVEAMGLISRIMDVLNSTAEGSHIFAGQVTGLAPFELSSEHVQYRGDAGEIRVRLGPHTEMVVNVPGSALINPTTAGLRGTLDVIPPLVAATRLQDLNLGSGWQPGSITVTDGTGRTRVLDLSAAADVAGLIAAVGSQSGGDLTLAIAADGRSLQLTGTGPLTAQDAGDGTTAQSLGLVGISPEGTLAGRDIRAAPQASTLLSDLPGLAGKLPLGSIVITQGGTATTVDLSTAAKLGDLQLLIGSAVPGLTLQFAGGALSLTSEGTQSFEVADAVGSAAATSLGLRGVGTPVRLFGVLEDLHTALLAHDKNAMRGLLAELGAVEDRVVGLTVQVGARETLLDSLDATLQQRDQQLQANRSRERDADLVETATDLSQAQAAYQASLLAASRLFATNLMDFLR